MLDLVAQLNFGWAGPCGAILHVKKPLSIDWRSLKAKDFQVRNVVRLQGVKWGSDAA